MRGSDLGFTVSFGHRMQNPRLKALDELASELERFELDLNQYYGDLEPQGVYDTLLTGKLGALARLCGTFGWSELAQQLTDELPLRCTAVETMEIVRGYVLPEIRRCGSGAPRARTPAGCQVS